MAGDFLVKLATLLVFFGVALSSTEFNLTNVYELLTTEERMKIFNTADEKEIPEYDIVSINWPHLRKRSLNNVIPLSLRAFDRDISISLKKATPLVNSNTPVHIFKTTYSGVSARTEYPFRQYVADVYEDVAQLASFTVGVDSNGVKYIHTGIVGSQNVSIHRVPNRLLQSRNRPSNMISKDGYYYIVNSVQFLSGRHNSLNVPPTLLSSHHISNIPDVIYPEILPLIDASYSATFDNFDDLSHYVLSFWNQVDLTYRSLSNPRFKLSIARLAMSEDQTSFPFIQENSFGRSMNYDHVLNSASRWLYQNQRQIPLNSYDIAIVQTSIPSGTGGNGGYTLLGIAWIEGACLVNDYEGMVRKVGVVYDNRKYGTVYIASHELGHLFGAQHDDDTECANYGLNGFIMAAVETPSSARNRQWSQCSIASFTRFLRSNPQCLFDAPAEVPDELPEQNPVDYPGRCPRECLEQHPDGRPERPERHPWPRPQPTTRRPWFWGNYY